MEKASVGLQMTKLKESHERALRSSLIVVEDNLRRLRDLLKEANPPIEQAITFNRINNINPKSKLRMANVITDMLNEIKQMKELFDLRTEQIDLRAEISAALNEIWIILIDLVPERFKTYGELSESERASIEPHITLLLSQLDEINKVLHGRVSCGL